jgi:hypothetical protein
VLLDAHLRHFDLVERHRAVVPASREDTYRALRAADFVRTLRPVARSITEIRDVPKAIVQLARRALRLPPDATYTLVDALAGGFALLGERHGRAVAVGAIGKLWKTDIAFRPIAPAEFAAFHEPKYAKLAIAFWVERFGRDKSVLRFEARLAATDDSARAHVRRWYRMVRPFTSLFMRRALTNIAVEAAAPVAP